MAAILAKLWVPVHGVNVKQHGSAGVGHICAVDAAFLPSCQTLSDGRHQHTHRVSLQIWHSDKSLGLEVVPYPDEPGVHGAEHGAVTHDGFPDLVYVVHQPAEFHCAEVSADRESCFMLQQENSVSAASFL